MENTTNGLFTSFVRTVVPLIVGSLVAFAATAGVELPGEALAEVLTVVISSAYYLFFRWLETKGVTWAGFFLGSRKQPEYVEAA